MLIICILIYHIQKCLELLVHHRLSFYEKKSRLNRKLKRNGGSDELGRDSGGRELFLEIGINL